MKTAHVSQSIPPIIKTITVPWSRAEAFRRFTAGMGDWWPTKTFSVAEVEDLEVIFEPHTGGLVYERKGDHRAVWAEVLLWDPESRFILNWHPGREADTGGPLEARFVDCGNSCRVELTHSGWEKLGDKATETRSGYNSGWDYVLGLYAS